MKSTNSGADNALNIRAKGSAVWNSLKRLIAVTGLILISCVLMSALAAPSAPEEPRHMESQTDSAPTEEYLIRDNNGRISVYRAGESTPFMTTETYTKTLPRADVNRLREGITAHGKYELRKTLEDFCS